MSKKAVAHTTLIIFLSITIAAVIAAATIISQMHSLNKIVYADVAENKERLVTNFDLVRVFVDGTQDGTISAGDNVTFIGRVLDGSGAIDLSDISIVVDGGTVSAPTTYNYSTSVGPNSYTLAYLSKGPAYKFGYVSPGDVVALKVPIFTGVVFREMERVTFSIGVLRQGRIVAYNILLPAALSSKVTVIYPFS